VLWSPVDSCSLARRANRPAASHRLTHGIPTALGQGTLGRGIWWLDSLLAGPVTIHWTLHP
jgi:hypothetical protein